MACNAVTHTCTPFAHLGTACGASQICDDGLTCANGVCATGATTLGAACSPDGPGCDQYAGLACNASTGTCANLVLASAGQACGNVAGQQQLCAVSVCTRGACEAKAPLGGACDLVDAPFCTSFATCVVGADGGTSGTCRLAGELKCP
jgi:hypothetical protein